MASRVLTAGEAMVLFAALDGGPLEQVPRFARAAAGAELNVAIGLARLGHPVAYLTRLGDDAFGRYLRGVIDAEGIDARWIAIDRERPTGFMLKSRSDDGSDPAVEYFRRGSAASRLAVADAPPQVFDGVAHLHLSGVLPAISGSAAELAFHLAAAARRAGCSISFDPNLRLRLWPTPAVMVETLNRLAAQCDWVLPGLAEGRLLCGCEEPQAIADFFLERGARQVFVKLGAQGAWHAAADGSRGHAAGVPVARVVDTVGAGDGFAVGVISALLEGQGAAAAAARGNRIGARVVTFPGDSDGLPTRAELQEPAR